MKFAINPAVQTREILVLNTNQTLAVDIRNTSIDDRRALLKHLAESGFKVHDSNGWTNNINGVVHKSYLDSQFTYYVARPNSRHIYLRTSSELRDEDYTQQFTWREVLGQ